MDWSVEFVTPTQKPTWQKTKLLLAFSKFLKTLNQFNFSILSFRHFFNHLYRKDLVDLLKEILLDPPQPALNPTDDDNPAALLRMLDFIESKDQRCELNLSRLTDLIDCSANITLDENGKEIKVCVKTS